MRRLRRRNAGRCIATGNGRRGARVLEAIQFISRKAGALRRTQERLDWLVAWSDVCLIAVGLGLGGAHFVPYCVLLVLLRIVLVEGHDIHEGLRMLLLLLFCNAILLQHALPFFR